MRPRNLLIRIFLALALVAGQQAAQLHELAHGLADIARHHDASDSSDQFCSKCLAFAGLGHTMASALPPRFAPERHDVEPARWVPGATPFSYHQGYLSRAPPSFS
ncbi:MAG: hypothetical protein ABSF50_20620 [Burkholderiaceae bacterium]|jgi:hypothetical protein